MLFIAGSNGTMKSIAFATSHSLTVSTDTQQTSTKDDGGKFQSSDYGIISWSITSEKNSVDDTTNDNWTPANTGTIGSTTKSLGYTGTVLITSVEVNAPNGENATFTVQLQGDGPLVPTED